MLIYQQAVLACWMPMFARRHAVRTYQRSMFTCRMAMFAHRMSMFTCRHAVRTYQRSMFTCRMAMFAHRMPVLGCQRLMLTCPFLFAYFVLYGKPSGGILSCTHSNLNILFALVTGRKQSLSDTQKVPRKKNLNQPHNLVSRAGQNSM